MRTLSFLVLFISTMFLLNSNVVFAQQTACPANEPNCSIWYDVTTTIPAPNFPNCSVSVRYQYRICNGENQFRIVGWGPLSSGTTACDPFIQSFVPNWPANYNNIDYNAIAQIFVDLERGVADDFFINLYNTTGSPGNSIYECPAQVGAFTASFYRPDCLSLCVGYNPNDRTLDFSIASCNPDGCCKLSRRYCYNTNTNELEATETVELQNETPFCENTELPTCSFRLGYQSIGQSPCIAICGQ